MNIKTCKHISSNIINHPSFKCQVTKSHAQKRSEITKTPRQRQHHEIPLAKQRPLLSKTPLTKGQLDILGQTLCILKPEQKDQVPWPSWIYSTFIDTPQTRPSQCVHWIQHDKLCQIQCNSHQFTTPSIMCWISAKSPWHSVCMAVLLCVIVFAGLKARVPISTKFGSSKPFPKLPRPQLYERWSHHHAAREAQLFAGFMEVFRRMARSPLWSRDQTQDLTGFLSEQTQKILGGKGLFNKQDILSNKITTTKVPRIDSKPPVRKSCFQAKSSNVSYPVEC